MERVLNKSEAQLERQKAELDRQKAVQQQAQQQLLAEEEDVQRLVAELVSQRFSHWNPVGCLHSRLFRSCLFVQVRFQTTYEFVSTFTTSSYKSMLASVQVYGMCLR